MENNGQLTTDPPAKYIAKVGSKSYAVNEDTGRIQFLDSRFYKAGDNIYVPSVTTILEAYPKGAAYFEWLKKNGADSDEIRDEAGRRGSVVHEMTETLDYGGTLTLMNEDGDPKYKIGEWAMLERYVDFRHRFPADIHTIELNLVSADAGFAGTLDRVMTIGDKTYLVDIKTSKDIWPTHWLQLAAYHHLLHVTGAITDLFTDRRELPEIHIAVLHLNSKHRSEGKKGAIQGMGWQFCPQDRPTADLFRLFSRTRDLWLEENGALAPKLTTYQLSHTLSSTTPTT